MDRVPKTGFIPPLARSRKAPINAASRVSISFPGIRSLTGLGACVPAAVRLAGVRRRRSVWLVVSS